MNDVDRLMAVMETAFDPHWREAWSRKQIEDSLALPNTYMLLADKAGQIPRNGDAAEGFVFVRRAADEEELLLIGVRPNVRNTGLGTKLLQRFFDVAKANGSTRVFLEMRDGNPAVSLYLRCGFRQIGRRKAYYRTLSNEAIDALTFAKDL
ncbi:GNAT family N-acetyltransferase [Erythrobacter litoralis]|uniref:GNAT family N-acetyltransferase n=1 Tax=Erythrobacter litoralis TaxID=39960 RepID=UPI002435A283|nr:GNAT family N-acetyltransferase [Erythrobacter litoralis]